MVSIRKETVGNFSDEKLLKMVKDNLDALGIPYEDGPGGLGDVFFMTPEIFERGI